MSQDADTSSGAQSTTDRPDDAPGSRVRSLDAIFELLGSARRRNVLYVLYRSADPVALGDLADEVASVEDAAPERVATALHQVHLPKLAAAGVVEYDAGTETARLAGLSERFRRYLLSAAVDESRPVAGGDEYAVVTES